LGFDFWGLAALPVLDMYFCQGLGKAQNRVIKMKTEDAAKEDELLPLVQKSFDLCYELYICVNRFPRAHKPLLGRNLLLAVQQMLICFVGAARRRDRLSLLKEADMHLEALRILVRLSHRLSFLSHKAYEVFSRELAEIGRMLGGWIKANRGEGDFESCERVV